MKKLNNQKKEIHLLVLFGLLTLLFLSVNIASKYSPQDNLIYNNEYPKTAAISINIVSPTNGEYFNATAPGFIVEISDPADTIDTMWYTIDGGSTNITFISNGTLDQTEWTAHGEGSVTLTFYANNSISEEDFASVIINKDSVDPTIDSIDSPSPSSYHSAPPDYSLSITETNLDTIWYTLDGGTNNYTGAVSGTIDSTAWTNAGQGGITITFYVNDSATNWDTASVGINKDSINPSIDSIDSPIPFSNHSVPPSYSLSITEANLDTIWYTLDGGTNNYTGAASGTIDTTAWTNAGQGSVTITFYVNDSAGNWDTAGVTITKDSIDPSIDSIDSPLSGTWFDSTPPTYSLSITETNLDTIWYTLDGGTNNYTGAASGTIDSTAWTNAGQGSVTITFYVNDSAGNWDTASVTITKDSVNPSIDSIDSPLSGTWFDSTPPTYSLSITETNLDTIWYTLDGGTNNYTGAASGTIDSTAWTNAGDGTVTITFYANDSAGNWDTASVIVNKDSLDPSIDSIVSPVPGSYYSTSPDYSLSITEANLDTIWYTLDGGTNNYTGAASGTIDTTAWTNAGQGSVTITFYVNDSVGNWDTASVTVNKDSVNPSIDSIDSPLPGTWFDSTPPTYSLSITETNLDTIWYTLDGGTNNYTGAASGTIDSTAWTNAGDGTVTITFYANDSAGNWDTASVIVNKDSLDPSIDSIDSPLPGVWFGGTPPTYSLSITEANLDIIWYTLNGGTNNYTGAASGTIDTTAWTNAGQGAVTITFYVNDSVGNWDTASVIVNKDSIDPSIDSIDSPLPGTWYDSTPPSYSLSITETNLDTIWYTLDGGTNNYTGAASGSIDSTAWTNAGQGGVTIIFYTNDTAGNWDTASVGINKDSIDPSIDSIGSPSPGSYHSSPPDYSLSITEANLDSIWYTLNGGTNNYTGAVSGTIDTTAWTNAGQGSVTITFYVNDSAGNWDTASVTINKDSVNPSIDSIDSPLSGTWFDSTPPTYSLSITETNLDTIWYTIDGGANNYTGAASGTIDSTAWSGAGQGAVTITFYANDSAGNLDIASVIINRDSINPSIDSIDSPLSGTWFDSTPPTYSLSITETNLDTIWYTLDGGANNYTGAASGTINSTAWSIAGQGSVTITFYVNDSAGNLISASVGVNRDTLAPVINAVSPLPGQTFGATAPNFIVEISDNTLDTMWYTIDAGLNNFTFIVNGTIDPTAWANLGDGPISVTITFYANDTFGHMNSASRTFNKNANAPDITIVSPTPGTYFGPAAPSFIVEIFDSDLDSMWYSLDDGVIPPTNITFFTNGTIDQIEWNALSDGLITLTFYANDTAGNFAYQYVQINRDTVAPTVNILTPIALQLLNINPPSFTVEINDPHLVSMWYSLDNGLTNYTFLTNGTFNQLAWDSFPGGSLTIYFYANDTAGNEAFDTVTVTVDKNVPTIIVNLPVDDTTIGTQPYINIIIYDTNVDSIWYVVAPYAPVFYTGNNTNQLMDLAIWDAIPEGPFTIAFFANDTAGNLNSLYTFNLIKDTVAPVVNIILPAANTTYYSSTPPEITLTINDANLDSAWYSIGGRNYSFAVVPGTNVVTIDQAAWNALSNGPVLIVFYANDSLYESSDSITLIRDIPAPFDFIAFLLSPFGIAIMVAIVVVIVVAIIIRRRKFHRTSDKEVRKIESLWD